LSESWKTLICRPVAAERNFLGDSRSFQITHSLLENVDRFILHFLSKIGIRVNSDGGSAMTEPRFYFACVLFN
jgi:hypothetical protein